MQALNCWFAEALCFGIGDYQHEKVLQKAAEDAENMASAFTRLGCCNTVSATSRNAQLTRENVVELVSQFVSRTKNRMQETQIPEEPLLVALFVASHGIHAHGKELPLVVLADIHSSETEQLVDLDMLLLNELAKVTPPRRNRRDCCVWIIMDTCRAGVTTAWQQHQSEINLVEHVEGRRGPYSLKTNLTPHFLFLLACDPGGWAADSNSLSSALVKFLEQDGISIKAACEKACDVVQQSWRGRQRPWLNQRAGEIFSNIRIIRRSPPRSPIPATEDLEVECLPRWVQLLMARILGFTVALVVLILFFSLFFCFKISGAEQVARGNECPGNSCFCTDCHHRDIYSNDRDQQDSAEFNCELWNRGPVWNRCSIARKMHVTKIVVSLFFSRNSWFRLMGFGYQVTALDLCVILVSVVNVLTSVSVPLRDPTYYVTLIANAYGILNFAFIAASIAMLMVIHAEFPGASLWSHGQIAANFTWFFLPTALIGQALIFWARAMGLISAEHSGKQEMLFYACHVFTAAIMAIVGFAKSKGNEGPVAKKSFQLLCVSLCWMSVVVAWLFTSLYDAELLAKYHLIRVVAERVCNCWKIHLMVWFSEHSIPASLVRGDLLGAAPWRIPAAKVVPGDSFLGSSSTSSASSDSVAEP